MKTPSAVSAALLLFLSFSLHAQQTYPPNIYADSAYYPFLYGVASGDPLQHRVILWTKVEAPDTVSRVTLYWQVARDSFFTGVVTSGQGYATRAHDFTFKVDATELNAGGNYFYRFYTGDAKYSEIGKAKTLLPNTTTHFKLALVSCSSVWSGYFNAYRRIAERSDIDFVVHVGDYIYDFVDKDEQVRVPSPYPTEPVTLNDWRARHKYYLLDPDLRAARQNKTWIAEWDNHDTHYKHREKDAAGIQAFYEYLPIRVPDESHPENIYREFHFGKLADLIMIDMYLFRGKGDSDTAKPYILGPVQDEWFRKRLITSTAKWKLIGNQEMMGSWLSQGIPKFIHVPGNGKYFDPDGWDGYNNDRNRLYHFLDSNHINNFVVLSGDMHMSFINDLTPNPKDKEQYNHHTGKSAVGVEVLGPSISRGGMAERPGVPRAFIPLIERISRNLNPQERWVNFKKHGYVTVDVTPQRCIAEFWYTPILYKSNKETFGRGYTVKDGLNHWQRKGNTSRRKSTHPKQDKN